MSTTNTAAKKGPTTIVPMQRMAKKRKEAGKFPKSAMAIKPTPEGMSSDEELLRSADALEKEVTIRYDEELM